LKSLATHKSDRNDARGLAHLARTGFFKPVHVKSLPAHAVRSLIIARKKLVGQRVTLENQIRGLAVMFGVRLLRSLSPAFIKRAADASDSIDGLSGAMRGLIAARNAVLGAIAAINADMKRLVRASDACRRLMTIPGVGQLKRSPSPLPSTTRSVSSGPVTSVRTLALCPVATSQVRSATPAASPNAATGE